MCTVRVHDTILRLCYAYITSLALVYSISFTREAVRTTRTYSAKSNIPVRIPLGKLLLKQYRTYVNGTLFFSYYSIVAPPKFWRDLLIINGTVVMLVICQFILAAQCSVQYLVDEKKKRKKRIMDRETVPLTTIVGHSTK